MSHLNLKNITKRYKKDTVVDDVSLTIEDGETVVLFGPSGAGKTVLLRIIAGVVDPEEGTVYIDHEDMSDVEAEYRGVGMAFQNFALFPHMSAFENIACPLRANRQSAADVDAGVKRVAQLLKIEHVLSHAPRELSNGQKQRTALARALVGEPPLLLLDDPLRNVDAKLRFEMRLELPRLLRGRGATVMYVTQDYKEAMALGDRIAVLREGRIEQIGTPADIYLQPANVGIAGLFGDPMINLFDVQPKKNEHGIFIDISGTELPIGDVDDASVGRACTLGIRPEYLSFVPAGTAGSIPVTVEVETPLNEKVVTLATTKGGREMLISRPSGTPGPTSGIAHIIFKKDSSLLFDTSTGKLLHQTSHSNSQGATA
jgi:multiple sugar transport system ATP-binding protein